MINIIKLCLVVDKHIFGPYEGRCIPPGRIRELFEKVDGYEVRPPLLKKIAAERKLPGSSGIEGIEREIITGVVASAKEIVFHGAGIVGDHILAVPSRAEKTKVLRDSGFKQFIDGDLPETIGQLGIRSASFHLETGTRLLYFSLEGDWWGEDPLSKEEWLPVFQFRLELLKERLQSDLAFENSPCYEEAKWPDFVSDPAYIRKIFTEVPGISLLLDLCHARISAATMEIRLEDYISALPLEKVSWLHFSGPKIVGKKVIEEHGNPQDDDYNLLQWLLTQGVRPSFLTVEHYNEDNLIMTYDRLRNVLAKYG